MFVLYKNNQATPKKSARAIELLEAIREAALFPRSSWAGSNMGTVPKPAVPVSPLLGVTSPPLAPTGGDAGEAVPEAGF